MPLELITVTGYCRPVVEPIAVSTGGAASVTIKVLLSSLTLQFEFMPQVTSPVVWLMPLAQGAGGPACEEGGPQSASAKRIVADDSLIGRLKVIARLSPVKRRPGAMSFARVSVALVEVRATLVVEFVTVAVN